MCGIVWMCHFNDISYCIFRETYFCTTHDKMSGQGTQRVRKSSPCPAKQGPMRATLPMSSLMRQGSNIRKSKSNSPTISPPSAWKTRTSPDATLSGQRSPGSLSYRGMRDIFILKNYRENLGLGLGQFVIRQNKRDHHSVFRVWILAFCFRDIMWARTKIKSVTPKIKLYNNKIRWWL